MSEAEKLNARFEILEAERLVLTMLTARQSDSPLRKTPESPPCHGRSPRIESGRSISRSLKVLGTFWM